MKNETQSNHSKFSLLHFIGIIWSIHVLIAAILFPTILLPRGNAEDPQNIRKENVYLGFRLVFGTLIFLFNILSIFILFTRPTMIDAVKVFFILGAWLSVWIIYTLFNHLRSIYRILAVLEDDAIQSRDQSVMLIRAGQTALQATNLKISGIKPPQDFSFVNLLKKVGPLAVLVLQKSSMKDIAFEAVKLAFSGTRLIKYLF